MPRTRSSSEKEVRCPGCGSYDFSVAGCVAYSQPYHSKTDSYAESKVFWDADWPHYVECANCEKDVTQLFKKAGILTQFFRHVPFKGGKGKYG